MRSWGDVSVYSQDEEEALLLGGVVQRARMQIGLFTVILTLTAAVIVMMVMYNLTLEKTHDLAVLKLMGAPRTRLLGLVLQQAWLLGALGYAVAFAHGRARSSRCSLVGCSSRRPSRSWRRSRRWASSPSRASSGSRT
jgi:predicted lysophospholipase L1 biosynthesis ABC-type transport system permease subunit